MRYITYATIFFLATQTTTFASNPSAGSENEGWTAVKGKPMSKAKQARLAQQERMKRQQTAREAEHRCWVKNEEKRMQEEKREQRECDKQTQILWPLYVEKLSAAKKSTYDVDNIRDVFAREVSRERWLEEKAKQVGREQALEEAPWRQPNQLEAHPFFAFSIEREMLYENRMFFLIDDIQKFLCQYAAHKSRATASTARKKYDVENEQVRATAAVPIPNVSSISDFPPLGSQ